MAAENLAPAGIQSMETVQPLASLYTDRAALVQNLIKKQRPLIENVFSTFLCLHRPTSWYSTYHPHRIAVCGIARAERDGKRAETIFRLSPKRTSPFKSVGGTSVQSTAGSLGVRISLSNVGCTTFGGGMRVLATHSIRQFPPSLPFPCVTVCHQVPNEV